METPKGEAGKVAFLGFDQCEVSTPITDHAVRLQLDLVLQSSLFLQSKRLSRFLRFVVERSLEGQADELKERTIATQVFDRALAYDSASDPIVRVAAGDLRKRLAQYYVQSAHTAELRIELPQGGYRPLFSWPSSPASPSPDVPASLERLGNLCSHPPRRARPARLLEPSLVRLADHPVRGELRSSVARRFEAGAA